MAKIPTAKNPYGEKSVRRKLRTAKNPTTKIPTAKNLTAKNPSANPANRDYETGRQNSVD